MKRGVVIPQNIRKKLKPRMKFLVTIRGDAIILKVLELLDIENEWSKIFKTVDDKYLKISEKKVLDEIQDYRSKKIKR